jgi:rod shape determining protein RodA
VRWSLLVAAALLAALGLATVASATSERGEDLLSRQALWVTLGVLALVVVLTVDYHVLMDLATALYAVGLVALVLVLVLGEERGGARSWLGIGSLGGQPSEYMKLATALAAARYLALSNRPSLGLAQVAVAVAIAAPPMVLVALEPDLGGAAMFVPGVVGMLLVAGVRWRILVGVGAVGLALAAGLFFFGIQDYQRQRILTFVQPGSDPLGAGYHVHQSKIAVGSGQLVGRGYMQGTQSQLRFLPERHTDFIFAVLAEEWGFVGVVTALALYALYFASATKVAVRARDRAGVLLVVGLLAGLAAHVLYNTAMVVGLLPITGVPLPFLSYGGSFTLANFLSTGLILGVDLRRHVNR